jgi:hypothetical protein
MRGSGITLVALFVAACDQSAFDVPNADEPPPGPGSPTWDDTDLSCSGDSDCAPGETCASGSCRPRQCDDGPYESDVPLGPSRVLFRDEEVFIVDGTASEGSYWIDGYDAAGAITYGGAAGGSTKISASSLVDVARIHTASGGGMVTAVAGSSSVTLSGRTFTKRTVSVGVVPVAVGAGDVDGDFVDDIVAMSSAGKISICQQDGGCKAYAFGNGETGVDLAVADVTGDGIDEIVFLLRIGDQTRVTAWSVDGDAISATFDVHFDAVTAGDIDNDGRAEVAALEDRGWFGFASDRVHLYRVGASFTGVVAVETTGSAVDLATGDVDASERDAVVVLGDNKAIDVLRWNGSSITKAFGGSVSTTAAPKRIALGDYDDDSVVARLKSSTPALVAGRLMPVTVVTFPPYDSTYGNGATSGVTFGSQMSTSEDFGATVSLNAGVEVGVDLDFAGIFKGRVGTRVSMDVSRGRNTSRRSGVGTSFSLRPQTDLYGNQYAAVVVACNCFHTYEYELVDTSNRASSNGKRMVMIVPVGGQTTVLSTPRYNALAKIVEGLPTVTVANRIGDPSSYPAEPKKLDGSPVTADEHVFSTRPTLRVSDVGSVAFSLSVGSGETNSAAMSVGVSVSGSLSAVGLSVGASLGTSWGRSYAISVGQDASFSGDVPPLPDRPNTQEDEYVTRGYSFSPYVYRQPYTDPMSGEQTGYYVLDYAVSR